MIIFRLIAVILSFGTLFCVLCSFTHRWNAFYRNKPEPEVSRKWADWWFKKALIFSFPAAGLSWLVF